LIAVHEALSRVERGQSKLDDELHEIRDGIEAFREALLEHFAREQEDLLPFVVTRLPPVRARVDQLITEHDRIAEALTTLVKIGGTMNATNLEKRWPSLCEVNNGLRRTNGVSSHPSNPNLRLGPCVHFVPPIEREESIDR
jgi:hypothetical protein